MSLECEPETSNTRMLSQKRRRWYILPRHPSLNRDLTNIPCSQPGPDPIKTLNLPTYALLSILNPEPPKRCRANSTHKRQSRPGSGLGFQVLVLKTFQVVPACLGSGPRAPQPHTPKFLLGSGLGTPHLKPQRQRTSILVPQRQRIPNIKPQRQRIPNLTPQRQRDPNLEPTAGETSCRTGSRPFFCEERAG